MILEWCQKSDSKKAEVRDGEGLALRRLPNLKAIGIVSQNVNLRRGFVLLPFYQSHVGFASEPASFIL